MSDPTFMADPTRLVIAAIVGIALLLALIIKFKLHPVLSMMVSALAIGIGAGMPLDLVADTVTKGVGTTLQNIALLIGLGSMFGQILEESGGAKKIAQTFIDTFGQGHSSWALGITGLVIGTTVFFEAGFRLRLTWHRRPKSRRSTTASRCSQDLPLAMRLCRHRPVRFWSPARSVSTWAP